MYSFDYIKVTREFDVIAGTETWLADAISR